MLFVSLNHQCRLLVQLSLLFAHVSIPAVAQEQPRQATPTVVNPVLDSEYRSTFRLDGNWDFAVDPEGQGEDEKWFLPDKPWPDRISMPVPGCWESQGLGGPGWSSPAPIRVYEAINRKIKGTYTCCPSCEGA